MLLVVVTVAIFDDAYVLNNNSGYLFNQKKKMSENEIKPGSTGKKGWKIVMSVRE